MGTKDYAYIIDGSALNVYDTTTNSVASNVAGESKTLTEVTLQGDAKGIAIKDALTPNAINFRSSSNFTLDVDHTNKYVVKPLSNVYSAGAGVINVTATDAVPVGTYTLSWSSPNLTLTRDKDTSGNTSSVSPSGASSTFTFTNGG